MPRRKGDSLDQNAVPSKKKKKQQQEKAVEQDVPIQSLYTVSELFHEMHFYLLKETFGYLDLRNSTKYSRVSAEWRDTLRDNVTTNKGVVFLDRDIGYAAQSKMENVLAELQSWTTLFSANFEGITHFVWIGDSKILQKSVPIGYRDNRNAPTKNEQCEKLFGFPHSLSKLTFIDSTFTDLKLIQMATFLLEEFNSITLKNCEIGTQEPEFCFNGHYSSPAWGNTWGPMAVNWNLKVTVPLLVFDETFQTAPKVQWTDEKHDWLYKQYDGMGLIWPYGHDQTIWLDSTLDQLKGKPLAAFKYADNQYLHWRPCYNMSASKAGLKPMGMEYTEATSDKRVLDTMDCAWFGRLLVCMNKAKHIPKFKPPPHEFPNDFDV